MLPSRGFGMLVAVVGVGSIVAADKLILTYAKEWQQANKSVAEFTTFAVTAIVLQSLAQILKHTDKPRTIVDMATGAKTQVTRRDAFLFLPVAVWPFIVMLLALYKLLSTE